MEEKNNKIVELDLETYEKMISENASMKKELEYFKLPKVEEPPIIVSNSHSLPESQEEKQEKKKGIFSFE